MVLILKDMSLIRTLLTTYYQRGYLQRTYYSAIGKKETAKTNKVNCSSFLLRYSNPKMTATTRRIVIPVFIASLVGSDSLSQLAGTFGFPPVAAPKGSL